MKKVYFEIGMKSFEDDSVAYLEYLKHDRVMMDISDLHVKIKINIFRIQITKHKNTQNLF